MPTETAVAPNGDIYIADGYGSDYIIQYNHKGQYIRHFGGRNNSNPEHNLQNAHGVTVDNRDPDDRRARRPAPTRRRIPPVHAQAARRRRPSTRP